MKQGIWTIRKCASKEDFDNNKFLESDGELYTAEEAIEILENGNGGSMYNEQEFHYIVFYNSKLNDWVKSQTIKKE